MAISATLAFSPIIIGLLKTCYKTYSEYSNYSRLNSNFVNMKKVWSYILFLIFNLSVHSEPKTAEDDYVSTSMMSLRTTVQADH